MDEEQSEEENGLVTTEYGRFDDETEEPEVILHLPRGSDPAPSWCRELHQWIASC